MPADLPSISRNEDRHSHIGIRLQYRTDDKWEYLEALEWNAVGFNFYHAQAMQEPELQLRRGLTRFTGSIVWQSLNTTKSAGNCRLNNSCERKKPSSGLP